MSRSALWVIAVAFAVAGSAAAAPTRSSPLAVAPDGHVFVVNPDSNTVARLAFDTRHAGTLTHEAAVGKYPRTLALAATYVFTADQNGDTVSRLDQADLGNRRQKNLGVGCNPYGITATPSGDGVLVTCQGSSELVLLDLELVPLARVKLAWPNPRAVAVSDAGEAYVTHFLTEEPGTEAHVSVVDVARKSVARVFAIPADMATCETQNSGQGPLNLLSAIAIVPAGPLAGQVWVGGTQENNISKGLFKRFPGFEGYPGAGLFPLLTFRPFPEPAPLARRHRKPKSVPFPDAAAARNIYKAAAHDITRFGIYKLDGGDGHVIGKLDVDEANNATDIEFSADGTVAFVVDQMFNSFHVFNTRKGQDGDVTTLFGLPSSNGPGGADPAEPCVADAIRPVTDEAPFRMAPQAQITPIGSDPVRFDASEPDPTQRYKVVDTGLDFDTATYMASGTSQMRAVPDGVGTAPFGVRLAPDGQAVYVANYLARNVVVVAAAQPADPASGKPANFRCSARVGQPCATSNDCARGGFCGHPGGASCSSDADCGAGGPCVQSADCVPLLLADPVLSIERRADNPGCASNNQIDVGGTVVPVCDPTSPAILDGKTLFNTAARDSSVPNQIDLKQAAPPFDDARLTGRVPGSVVSTSRDASYVTCSTCHADFGGQDGRTWDFSQLGSSLRNSMDLRGRAGFAPGHCSNAPSTECFFDAACGDGNACQMRPDLVPPNIPAADRGRYFNPMLTIHWNGDRDEVEDFEHTLRSLMGAGDCDGQEDVNSFSADPTVGAHGCLGALVQRNPATSSDPVDVHDDLSAPNRNLRGVLHPDQVVGVRLTHLADFVYSLTEFVQNPHQPDAVSERGRLLFNDPQTRCARCHDSAAVTGNRQFFTDKRPRTVEEGFDPASPAGADRNNPFLRHNVGTINVFDGTDPNIIAQKTESFANANVPIPAHRGRLGDYVTPVLNDVWNSAPYLHDGSAPFLLDVVRPCDSTLDDCFVAGRGRNLDDLHGVTSILTPDQLNELTAFQKSLTLETPVGTGDRVVFAGSLELTAARLAFPRRGGGVVALRGILSAAPGPLDAGAGVTLSVATPGGEQMAVFRRCVPMRARRKGFAGHVELNRGRTVVKLRRLAGGRLRLTARGAGSDLRLLDTGNRELTVAFEVPMAGSTSPASFVKTRSLRGAKRVFRLLRPQR